MRSLSERKFLRFFSSRTQFQKLSEAKFVKVFGEGFSFLDRPSQKELEPLGRGRLTDLAREAQALFVTADPETKTLLRKLLRISLQKASETESLKKKIEEISAHSDSAFNALKDVSDHTREMSAGITKTTSG